MDDSQRYRHVAEELQIQSEGHFADTWRSWSNAERKVIMAISLAQMTTLAEEHYFDWAELIEDITDYSPEIRGLEKSGTLAEVEPGKWHVTQGALLWWLADEIKRQIRDEASLDAWLESQELTGVLTQKEKRDMIAILGKLGGFLAHGATAMIESFAKGVGEGLGESTIRMGL